MKAFYQKYKTASGNIYSEEKWSDEQIAEMQIDSEKAGVKFCAGNYVDIHRVPKGKVVPLSHFHQFAHGSDHHSGYALDWLG